MNERQKKLNDFIDIVQKEAIKQGISYQISCGLRYGEPDKMEVCEQFHETKTGDINYLIRALVKYECPISSVILLQLAEEAAETYNQLTSQRH